MNIIRKLKVHSLDRQKRFCLAEEYLTRGKPNITKTSNLFIVFSLGYAICNKLIPLFIAMNQLPCSRGGLEKVPTHETPTNTVSDMNHVRVTLDVHQGWTQMKIFGDVQWPNLKF